MALEAHFINVGKGSSTVIDHPSGRVTLVDIDDSRTISYLEKALISILKGVGLTNPIDYLNLNFSARDIFRFILTHPDMNHLSGIKDLFSRKKIYNFWDTNHNKTCDSWEGSPYDEEDWKFYQELREGKINGVTILKNLRGQKNIYWSEDGIEVLHPHPDILLTAEETEEYDHISQVLKISHNGKSILLCGDATIDAFDHMLSDSTINLSSDILLAPGHGSKNHIKEEAIKSIGHRLTVVSVAENVEYDINFYSQFGPVLSTKHYGNIRLSIEDTGNIFVKTQIGKYSDKWYLIN